MEVKVFFPGKLEGHPSPVFPRNHPMWRGGVYRIVGSILVVELHSSLQKGSRGLEYHAWAGGGLGACGGKRPNGTRRVSLGILGNDFPVVGCLWLQCACIPNRRGKIGLPQRRVGGGAEIQVVGCCSRSTPRQIGIQGNPRSPVSGIGRRRNRWW